MPFKPNAPMVTLMALMVAASGAASISLASDIATENPFVFAGGSYTVFVRETGLLSSPAPNLTESDREAFFIGKAFFENNIRADKSKANPRYNAKTCTACHRPTENDFIIKSESERFGFSIINNQDDTSNTFTLFDSRIKNQEYQFITIAELKKKTVLSYGGGEIFRAVPLIGLGIIDEIPDEEILQNEEFQKTDAGPESGIAVRVAREFPNKIARFGWQPTHANLASQIKSAAYNENGRRIETLSDYDIQKITSYVRFLSVPNRRGNIEPGEGVFVELRCSVCHKPYYKIPKIGQVSPFSDFLSHDIGTGTKGMKRFRTPPLWGIGMYLKDPRYSGLLHDGRAVDLADAIRQHRGEAEESLRRYENISDARRSQLLTWLKEL